MIGFVLLDNSKLESCFIITSITQKNFHAFITLYSVQQDGHFSVWRGCVQFNANPKPIKY